MSANLESLGQSCVADAAGEANYFDLESVREDARDRAHEAAESACTYTSDCVDIIRRYESDHWRDAEDMCTEKDYTAMQWQEAMQAYAFWIARSAIESAISKAMDSMESALNDLVIEAQKHGCPDTAESDVRVSSDCPHGWAPHEYETAVGVHYWAPGELEGCKAVAVRSAGIWLSFTWTPCEDDSESKESDRA